MPYTQETAVPFLIQNHGGHRRTWRKLDRVWLRVRLPAQATPRVTLAHSLLEQENWGSRRGCQGLAGGRIEVLPPPPQNGWRCCLGAGGSAGPSGLEHPSPVSGLPHSLEGAAACGPVSLCCRVQQWVPPQSWRCRLSGLGLMGAPPCLILRTFLVWPLAGGKTSRPLPVLKEEGLGAPVGGCGRALPTPGPLDGLVSRSTSPGEDTALKRDL